MFLMQMDIATEPEMAPYTQPRRILVCNELVSLEACDQCHEEPMFISRPIHQGNRGTEHVCVCLCGAGIASSKPSEAKRLWLDMKQAA